MEKHIKLFNTNMNHITTLRGITSTSFARKGIIAPILLMFFSFFSSQVLEAQELKRYIESHRNDLSFNSLISIVYNSKNDSLDNYLTRAYIQTLQPSRSLEKIYFNLLRTTFDYSNLDLLLEISNDIKKIVPYNSDIKLAKALISLRIGGCYRTQKNDQTALQYYTEAYDIIKGLDIENYQVNNDVLIGFGEFYLLNKLPNLALIKLIEAEKALDKVNNIENTINCYNSIGLCYQELKQWHLSNLYFQKVISFSKYKEKHKGQNFWIGLASGNMGYNYFQLKEYEKALDYLIKDYHYSLDAQNYISAFNAAILITKIEFQLEKRKEAQYWLANAERIFPTDADKNSLLSINEVKLLYYLDIKDYKTAFEIQQVNNVLKDSLWVKKERENILASTYKLEIEKKDQEVVFEQEYSRLKTIVFLILASLIAIAFYTFFRQKQRQTQRAEAHNKQIEDHALKLEQSNLFINNLFLIIAHDLKEPTNTFQDIVGNINYLIKNKQYESLLTIGAHAEKLSIHLSLTLENLFKWGLLEQKKLKIQKKQYNLYKAVLNLKYEVEALLEVKNIKLDISIPQDLEADVDISILSIILRNFISNAIKFSIPSQTIAISAEGTATTGFCINVSDSGLGMDEEQQKQLFEINTIDRRTTGTMGERGSGIGLLLCSQLAQFADMSIRFTSEKDKGSIFTVCI